MAGKVELQIAEGITEHSSRVALKGVFQNFGDVVSCWVPPVDRRGTDRASVRFANAASAEAAKEACDAGQVFLQGMMVKADWRTGGGRRVGNSDLGQSDSNPKNDFEDGGMRALALMDRDRYRARGDPRDDRRKSRSRKRRSRSRRRSRSKGNRERSRGRGDRAADRKGRERERSLERRPEKEQAARMLPPSIEPPPGAFSGVAAAGVPPPAPLPAFAGAMNHLSGIETPDPAAAAAAAALAVAHAELDPAEEKRKREELKAAREKRAKELKRGPGVAALVQGALKRAQEAPSSQKKDELVEKAERQLKEREEQEINERYEEARKRMEEKEKAEAERRKLREEEQAREREAAKRKAEAFAEAVERDEKNREERIRASVEAAKKQQANRAAGKSGKEAENLYGDMPQPNPDDAASMEAAMKAAADGSKAPDLALPPEDRSKVVFLDIDGVLRPARAGTFDISTDGDSASKPDTSDFFPAAIKALRHIMERSSALVVLCSEWRHSDLLLKALADTFSKNRLRVWSDVTTKDLKLEKGPDALRCFADRRSREISEWLKQHDGEVSGWVVLDDINLSISDEARKDSRRAMGPHHVQTWPLCGLTMGNAKTAVRILNGALINKVIVERPVAPVLSGGKA